MLLTPPPADRDGYIEAAVAARVFSSKRYFDADVTRKRAAAAFDRCFYAEGLPRQLAAIYASGDRTAALAGVTTPTLVVHGRDDTLITPSGGDRDRRRHPRGPSAAARRHGPRPARGRCGR